MCTSIWVVFTAGLFHADAAFWHYIALHWLSAQIIHKGIQSSWNIYKCSFKAYGYSHKQANKHTHVCNAVLLVWGLLRLTPISMNKETFENIIPKPPSLLTISRSVAKKLPVIVNIVWWMWDEVGGKGLTANNWYYIATQTCFFIRRNPSVQCSEWRSAQRLIFRSLQYQSNCRLLDSTMY